MKCEHCGNNLALEDEVCPYCGKENKLAKKHNRDMSKYEADYASVRNEVLSNSRRFNGFTIRITIIAVLVALIAFVLLCLSRSYDIRYEREQKLIMAHIDEHTANLDRLIESRDYQGVYYYCQVNNLSYSDKLNDYYIAYTSSGQFKQLTEYIYYLFEEDSYVSPEEAMEHIAGIMERILEIRDPESDYEKKKYYNNEEVKAFVNDLTDRAELLIKGYFELSDDDMREFESLSKARKQLMLEEGWENEK